MPDLNDEIAKGQRIKRLYDEFFGEFFTEKKAVLIEAFEAINPENVNAILEIKRTVMVLNSMNQEIKQYIMTGKLASITQSETGKENDS